MKPYWFNKRCCVPECFNSSTEGEGCYKEFFDLPAEPQSRSRWLQAILSGDGEDLKICEDHFREDDLFRDKNHRKKLRLNSIPSMKLPQNICHVCLGATLPPKHSEGFEAKMCRCVSNTTSAVLHTPPEKRMRVTWTSDEKRTLFKAIKKHGDVKLVNSHIRINWNSVFNHCRDKGCFGNEKELKTAWQYLRVRATKVYKNEIYGTKLERKVSRFLYGKGPKLQRFTSVSANNDVNGSELQPIPMEAETSDDEFNEEHMIPTNDDEVQQEKFVPNNNNEEQALDKCLNETQQYEEDKKFDLANVIPKNEDADTGNESCSDSDDEYYSIEDVENKLGIKIASTVPEVISLISSDDSGPE